MRPETFRGKNIFGYGGKTGIYPAVYMPEHPVAPRNGVVYIHRAIAYEKYGPIVLKQHVHHKDGDTWNWAAENLEHFSAENHAKEHHPKTTENRACAHCQAPLEVFGHKLHCKISYCDEGCRRKGQIKINWPSNLTLKEMLKHSTYVAVAKELGVTDNAIRKKLKTGWYSNASVVQQ